MSTGEVEAAFQEFLRRGAYARDWPAWAAMFTDDATYIEHSLGTFQGRSEIEQWIVPTMASVAAMTFSIDWWIVEGARVVFYIWNHLPDPVGGTERYSFPNVSFLEYAGDGLFRREEDFYNPADAERGVGSWFQAGGAADTPPDDSLTAIADFTPQPVATVFPRQELEQEFGRYVERGAAAVSSGDWAAWAQQFTPDARYFEHAFGKMRGRDEILAWIVDVMKPFPTMDFPVDWHVIDGNRVAMLCQNRLPEPPGGGGPYQFPVLTVLHYAGNGQWSYEEDAYNPNEASTTIQRWLDAGGLLPQGVTLPEP